MFHVACKIIVVLCPGKLHGMTKNLQRQVRTIIEHLQKQDTRMGDMEDANKALYSHFVQQRQRARTVFPLRTVQQVLDYAEAGEFDDLIAV